jgi:hypothetical protein
VILLRGITRIIAAAAGLLLVYAVIFALEGMTTRLPTSAGSELATTALWTTPWLLLFCSGLQDIVTVTGTQGFLWCGAITAMLSLYYFDYHTSLSLATKAAIPPIALAIGMLPCFINKIEFLFVLSSIAAGIAGACVAYNVVSMAVSPTAHFATSAIAALLVTFSLSGIACGMLAIFDVYDHLRRHLAR